MESVGVLALVANRYEIYTRPQDACYHVTIAIYVAFRSSRQEHLARLRREQWESLQEMMLSQPSFISWSQF